MSIPQSQKMKTKVQKLVFQLHHVEDLIRECHPKGDTDIGLRYLYDCKQEYLRKLLMYRGKRR